jgi:uncharacterized membrane protein YidH (DUF202 family)
MGILFIVIGILILVLTILRIPFFWNARKALRMRRLLGDSLTMILYIGIGIMMGVIGILELLGKLN